MIMYYTDATPIPPTHHLHRPRCRHLLEVHPNPVGRLNISQLKATAIFRAEELLIFKNGSEDECEGEAEARLGNLNAIIENQDASDSGLTHRYMLR